MSEVVNALVAFAVIIFIFRWATSGSSSSSSPGRSATATLGFRPKHVTQEMVEQIHAMFPDIPTDSIRYDLLRTGNVELTSNKILERGFLEPPPPAYFTLYPRPDGANAERRPLTARAPASSSSSLSASTATARTPDSLIDRYHLRNRIAESDDDVIPIADAGGKAKWEDTPEKREASLRERKAQMVLAARQRILAQQQNKASGSGSGSRLT